MNDCEKVVMLMVDRLVWVDPDIKKSVVKKISCKIEMTFCLYCRVSSACGDQPYNYITVIRKLCSHHQFKWNVLYSLLLSEVIKRVRYASDE
jgi:hypothetical protein